MKRARHSQVCSIKICDICVYTYIIVPMSLCPLTFFFSVGILSNAYGRTLSVNLKLRPEHFV